MLLVIPMVKKCWKILIKTVAEDKPEQIFRIEKKKKKKSRKKIDNLYVKWKRYDNSFRSWIVMKDII